nr:hypothetical protein [Tanacetum cinerariifolium]
MNPQETQQIVAHDEKWVLLPRESRSALLILYWKPQCHKRKRHFMWTILDICLRVEGVDFKDVLDDDTTFAFLIDIGYNGPFNKHTNLFMDTCISHGELWQRRDKGSQGKKMADTPMEEVEVSEESKPEPAKKRTTSKRRVKKKVTIFVAENIILDLDVALELGKLINEGTGSKPGVPDESIVVSATSGEGTGTKPRVLDEEKVTEEKAILDIAFSSVTFSSSRTPGLVLVPLPEVAETTIDSSGTPEHKSEYSNDDIDDVEKDDKDGDADDKGDDHISDTHAADDKDDEIESKKDEIYKSKICVRIDEDEEMKESEVIESKKDEEETIDTAKTDAEKKEVEKDDPKKAELPPSSSSLSISSGFGDQFLKLSYDSSLISTVKDTAEADISYFLDIPIQQETPHIQSPPVQTVLVSMIHETTNLPPSLENLNETPVTTTVSSPLDAYVLKNVDYSTKALVLLESHVLAVFNSYLDSKGRDEYEKFPSEIIKIKREHAEKQKTPKYTIKSTNKAALKEYDQKSALYHTMHENKSFNRNPANYRFYHELIKALIKDEDAMDKGVTDKVQDHKRKHDDDDDDDDDEGPSARLNQGKQTKRRRTKESESPMKPSSIKYVLAKEPIEESITKVVMDDASNDEVCDDDQPHDSSKPKTCKTP